MNSSHIEPLEDRTHFSTVEARFRAYQYSSEQFFFDASPTRGDYTKLVWHFGDGKTGKGVALTHTFPAPGTYRVKLTAYDAESHRDDYAFSYITGDTKKTASITGTVFYDSNYNGRRDKIELKQPVDVFIDANRNAFCDIGEVRATTDFYGGYRFLNLKAGTYFVRTGLRADSGHIGTAGDKGYKITVSGGEASSGHDFGQASGARISTYVVGEYPEGQFFSISSGAVYIDENDNRQWDDDEKYAFSSGGVFNFSGLRAGTYPLRYDLSDDLQMVQHSPSNNAAIVVKVGNGQSVTAPQFVLRPRGM